MGMTITREEAMKRFMESKRRKQQRVAELEKRLREKYKERTGKEPKHVFSFIIHCYQRVV